MLCSLIPQSVRCCLFLVFHLPGLSLFYLLHPCLAACLFWLSLAAVLLSGYSGVSLLLSCLASLITMPGGASQSFRSVPHLSSLPLCNGSAPLSSSSTGLSFCQFNVIQFKAHTAQSQVFLFPN